MGKPLSKSSRSVFALILVLMFSCISYQYGFTAVINDDVKSPFTEIYEKVSPSVVLIEVETETQKGQNNAPNPMERFFNLPSPQQQTPRKPGGGIGSGVIISREGHILTNNHVVENTSKIDVKLNNTEQYKAEVVGRDPLTDLAVIKLNLDGKLLPEEYVAELGDSDSLKPGDYAIAIGNPVGLERTITVGIISAIGRYDLQVYGANLQFQNFIQTDAQINPGNSGGALVDINGKVVGINNMYEAHYAAIGFAIPINIAKKVSSQLIQKGVVKRGFVGLSDPREGNSSITKEIQEAMNLPTTQGFLVNDVLEGSPAQIAGLVHGDVVTALDGIPLKDFHDFMMKVAEHDPGDVIKLSVIHEGKEKIINLTLADRDDYQNIADAGGQGSGTWLGISVVDLSSHLAKQYNLEDIKNGVLVASIENDSPAADVNLKEGDVILEIQSQKIDNTKNFEEVKNKLKDSKKPLLIYRLRKMSNGSLVPGYVAIKNQ